MRRVWPGSGLGSTILLPLTKKTRVEDVEAEAAAAADTSMVTVSCEELSHWRWILMEPVRPLVHRLIKKVNKMSRVDLDDKTGLTSPLFRLNSFL